MGTSYTSRELCSACAMALYWAWVFFMFFTTSVQTSSPASIIPLQRAVNLGAESLALMALVVLTFRHAGFWQRLFSAPAIAMAAIFAPLIAVIGIVQETSGIPVSNGIHMVCGILSGTGQAIAFAQVFTLLMESDDHHREMLLVVSCTAAGFIALIFFFPQQNVSQTFAAFLIPAAEVFALIARRLGTGDTERYDFDGAAAFSSKASGLNQLGRPSIKELVARRREPHIGRFLYAFWSMALFGLLFGAGSTVASYLGLTPGFSIVLLAPFLIQGLTYLPFRSFWKQGRKFATITSWLMVAVIIAMLPIPFFGASVRMACLAVLLVASQTFFLMCLIEFMDISAPKREMILLFLGLLSDTLGKAIGWTLGFTTIAMGSLNERMLMYLIILLVAVLVIWKNYAQNDAALSSEAATPSPAPTEKKRAPWHERIEAIGDEYGLSAREKEVLKELAKGRTARYIGEQLFISEGTAKSHTYRIYQKLGIHSQQELIDLVDSFTADNNPSDEMRAS